MQTAMARTVRSRRAVQACVIATAFLLGTPAQAADAPSSELRERLAAASAARGADAFEVCAACHSAERGGEESIGPNLWGVVNRPVANEPGFDYSDALLALGGTWTVERLEKLIENPNAVAPGNTMGFYGVRNAEQRADILAYLLTLRDEGEDEDEDESEERGEAERKPE